VRAPTHFAGIDPGLNGALAVLAVTPGAQKPRLVWVKALPTYHKTVAGKERRTYALDELAAAVAAISVYEPVMCAIEQVMGHGQQKGSSTFGYGVGLLHMAAAVAKLPVHLISPTMWKAALRCPASKPRTARIAAQLIDHEPGAFTGPKNGILDGNAEAALLAYWAWTRFGRK